MSTRALALSVGLACALGACGGAHRPLDIAPSEAAAGRASDAVVPAALAALFLIRESGLENPLDPVGLGRPIARRALLHPDARARLRPDAEPIGEGGPFGTLEYPVLEVAPGEGPVRIAATYGEIAVAVWIERVDLERRTRGLAPLFATTDAAVAFGVVTPNAHLVVESDEATEAWVRVSVAASVVGWMHADDLTVAYERAALEPRTATHFATGSPSLRATPDGSETGHVVSGDVTVVAEADGWSEVLVLDDESPPTFALHGFVPSSQLAVIDGERLDMVGGVAGGELGFLTGYNYATLERGTPLFGEFEGAVVGRVLAQRSLHVVDRSNPGWLAVEVPTPWGIAVLWTNDAP